MNKATIQMKQKILETEFNDPKVKIVSNVTADPLKNSMKLKNY